MQTVMERKKRFVSIRKELKDEQDEGDEVSSFHLASQYLADSSLSEDLSRYDFSVSVSAQVGRTHLPVTLTSVSGR